MGTEFVCRYCQSTEMHLSRRRGLVEKLVLPLFLRRPFRCHTCLMRQYAFIWRKGKVRQGGDSSPTDSSVREG